MHGFVAFDRQRSFARRLVLDGIAHDGEVGLVAELVEDPSHIVGGAVHNDEIAAVGFKGNVVRLGDEAVVG